jgi:predicted enzyme related to lactoylglutathione lyase
MDVRFVHVNLVARDWKLLSDFYQRVFNCEPVPPERNHRGDWIDAATGVLNVNIQGIHLILPGCDKNCPTLEIFQYNRISEAKQPAINQPGLAHIAFAVDDVEVTAKRVISNGGSQLGEMVTEHIPQVGTITFVYVRDPEGNIIELQNWSNKITD